MRVLLDENFPEPVMQDFVGHECGHVITLGWAGIKNGELLTRAEQAAFNVFVTFDANIPKQNELTGRDIAVFVLKPEGQGVQATRALMGEVLVALESCQPGTVQTFTNRTR
jgi:hypothetical protein